MQSSGRYAQFETTMWGDIAVGGSVSTPTTSGNVIFSGDNNSITNGTFNTIVGGSDNALSASGSSNAILCGIGNSITGTSSSCSITGGNANTISNSVGGHIGAGSNNTLSGLNAVIDSGSTNTASGAYSSIPGGRGALANNYGQRSWAGGSFFSAQGDSQESQFILRDFSSLGAGFHILYLDYPTNTQEIQLGGSSYGILELTLIAGKTVLNESSFYKGSFHYTTIAQGLGHSLLAYDVTPQIVRSHWGSTFVAVPTVEIISNNILRIRVNITSGSDIRILAQVRLLNLVRS